MSRRDISLLHDPIGVIMVDEAGEAVRVIFNPARSASAIVILKKAGRRWLLACEVGLRKGRPYRQRWGFNAKYKAATLDSSEWAKVLPHLIGLLRRWVEWGTAGWRQDSYFKGGLGSWVNRPLIQIRQSRRRVKYVRPRFLLVTVSHGDPELLKFFRRLVDYTLVRQRGSQMALSLEPAILKGKTAKIKNLFVKYFPEKLPLSAPDHHFFLAFFLRLLPAWTAGRHLAYRALLLKHLFDNDEVSRMIQALDTECAEFEKEAAGLLGENAAIVEREWPERGYTVFRYSLGLLRRVS